jgi:hypothetical protein
MVKEQVKEETSMKQVASSLFLILDLFFNPKDGVDMFL